MAHSRDAAEGAGVRAGQKSPPTAVQGIHRGGIESYGDALQHSNVDVSSLVGLYAKISRMRVLSSTAVTERADQVTRMIVETYMAPNKTVPELGDLMIQGKLDALSDFSEACRMELG
jgi:hypothetical protein